MDDIASGSTKEQVDCINEDKAASLRKLLQSKHWESELDLQLVMKYFDRLVERNYVTEEDVCATSVEQLMDAGLSLGAAGLFRSKFPSHPDPTMKAHESHPHPAVESVRCHPGEKALQEVSAPGSGGVASRTRSEQREAPQAEKQPSAKRPQPAPQKQPPAKRPQPALEKRAEHEYGYLPMTDFKIIRPLGSGETGTAELASIKGTMAAFKSADVCNMARETKLLAREAKAYCAMEHLQGVYIPRLVGHGYTWVGLGFYVATELLEGKCAAKEEKGSFTKLLPKAEEGLQAIHASGYAHGDVRPGNVILDQPAGKVWFIDFGRSYKDPSEVQKQREMRQLRAIFRPRPDSHNSPDKIGSSG